MIHQTASLVRSCFNRLAHNCVPAIVAWPCFRASVRSQRQRSNVVLELLPVPASITCRDQLGSLSLVRCCHRCSSYSGCNHARLQRQHVWWHYALCIRAGRDLLRLAVHDVDLRIQSGLHYRPSGMALVWYSRGCHLEGDGVALGLKRGWGALLFSLLSIFYFLCLAAILAAVRRMDTWL